MSIVRATAAVVVATVILAACGSGMPAARPAPSTIPRPNGHTTAKISTLTKMICESEAERDIATALGAKSISPLTPTWTDHDYSCRYVYKQGVMRLSVKQLDDAAATQDYFRNLETRLGRRETLAGLGQGAFTTADDSVVVRKDDKVLVVDVHRLPAMFGVPADTRANVAISVAATIMGCWTGG